MKVVALILLLGALALCFNLPLAALGMVLVVIALLLGQLPPSACNHNCNQARNCSCQRKGGA